MSASALPTAAPERLGVASQTRRTAFLGPPPWIQNCCPAARREEHETRRLTVLEGTDPDATLERVRRFAPQVTVVFDPICLPAEVLLELPGLTLGVVVGGVEGRGPGMARAAAALDRVVSFRPALSGMQLGSARVWRAIPPPIADHLFAAVRPLHGRFRALTVGRSTEYRERMLLPAKHHHDLLQVISGVDGERLAELMRDHEVGVYVPPVYGGGFGAQVGMHLAAGQLLFAHRLEPPHGLERDIDYLNFDSPEELVWAMDRLARFPEMHERVRVRGRMKAEGYRASWVFGRLLHDLELDVAAFGSDRALG
jgi:hypothetical protein